MLKSSRLCCPIVSVAVLCIMFAVRLRVASRVFGLYVLRK